MKAINVVLAAACLTACLTGTSRAADLKSRLEALSAKKAEKVEGDYWVGTKTGPYMLETHNETIYPSKPFIMVWKKLVPEKERAIREGLAKAFAAEPFGDAPVLVAADVYAAALKAHPKQAKFIKQVREKTRRFLTKEGGEAIAFRPAKDGTEGSLR